MPRFARAVCTAAHPPQRIVARRPERAASRWWPVHRRRHRDRAGRMECAAANRPPRRSRT